MATADQVISGVNTGVNVYNTLSGSSGSGTRKDALGRNWCAGRPEDWQIQMVLTVATDAELQPIVVGWPGSGRPGATTTPLRQANPTEVGYWLWGHADCKHSGPTGYAQQARMIQLVSQYALGGLTGQGDILTPTTYTPPPPTGGPIPAPVATHTTSTGRSYVQQILDGIGKFFTGILGGGLSGAANAAQAGGNASQASAANLITLVLVGVVIWLLLRK